MTKHVLEIPNQGDLELLLPLLRRLRIGYASIETSALKENDIEDALRIVRLGCDMNTNSIKNV